MSVYYQQSVWSSVVSAQTVEKDAAMTDAVTRLDSVFVLKQRLKISLIACFPMPSTNSQTTDFCKIYK